MGALFFKSDSEKLTEAVTSLENLSTQFDSLSEEVLSNSIDSGEFNFKGASQAIANNISAAGQKVKISADFITEVMNTQENIQNEMVFNFDDYVQEAEEALNNESSTTTNSANDAANYSGGGSYDNGYVTPVPVAPVPVTPPASEEQPVEEPVENPEESEEETEEPGEVTEPIEDTVDPVLQETIETKFKDNGFNDKAVAGIMINTQENADITSNIGETENGYGIFQWEGTRKDNLLQYAEENGLDPTDINVQLDFALMEMTEGTTYTNEQALLVKGLINNAPTVKDAEYLWKTYFINKNKM